MRIIEFKCDACGWEFRKMSTAGEDDQAPVCPACGSHKTREKISPENDSDGDDSSARNCSHGVFT